MVQVLSAFQFALARLKSSTPLQAHSASQLFKASFTGLAKRNLTHYSAPVACCPLYPTSEADQWMSYGCADLQTFQLPGFCLKPGHFPVEDTSAAQEWVQCKC